MQVVVVVGNPKPGSRTRHAAEQLAVGLGGDSGPAAVVIELAELGPELLGWGSPIVARAVRMVEEADVAVFASPTYKATYTGLLKLFLDQFAGGSGLRAVVAVPLMLGAGQTHALAPEVHLRPVLSELGATCATAGLYLLDGSYEIDGVMQGWLERWRPVVETLTRKDR